MGIPRLLLPAVGHCRRHQAGVGVGVGGGVGLGGWVGGWGVGVGGGALGGLGKAERREKGWKGGGALGEEGGRVNGETGGRWKGSDLEERERRREGAHLPPDAPA